VAIVKACSCVQFLTLSKGYYLRPSTLSIKVEEGRIQEIVGGAIDEISFAAPCRFSFRYQLGASEILCRRETFAVPLSCDKYF
jgi:hypothetical protein